MAWIVTDLYCHQLKTALSGDQLFSICKQMMSDEDNQQWFKEVIDTALFKGVADILKENDVRLYNNLFDDYIKGETRSLCYRPPEVPIIFGTVRIEFISEIKKRKRCNY